MTLLENWKEARLVYRRGRRPKGLSVKRSKPGRSSFQYNNFPQTIHGRAVLRYDTESLNAQRILIKLLREFNRFQVHTSITLADREGYLEGQIAFEVGIANGDHFNYLDGLEERLVDEVIAKQGTLPIADFLIVLRYILKDHQRHPIRADSYLLRFISTEYTMEMYLFHEKGIRRVNPDELMGMIAKELNRQLRSTCNTSLKVEALRAA